MSELSSSSTVDLAPPHSRSAGASLDGGIASREPTPDLPLEDRFQLPAASVWFNAQGEPVYGLPERPIQRPQRHDFEAQKAAENARALDKMAQRPTGLAHGAAAYLLHAQQRETLQGEDAQQARGICRVRRNRTTGTSAHNPILPCVAAAPLDPACLLPSPRLARHSARAAYEAAHSRDAYLGEAREEALLSSSAHFSRLVQAGRAAELELQARYPHGLPKSLLREARGQGMKVAGLGYGFTPSAQQWASALAR